MPALKVVPIGKYNALETAAVLRALAVKAEDGELAGVTLCARQMNGDESVYSTGVYRKAPRTATAASALIYWRSMQMQDAADEAQTY